MGNSSPRSAPSHPSRERAPTRWPKLSAKACCRTVTMMADRDTQGRIDQPPVKCDDTLWHVFTGSGEWGGNGRGIPRAGHDVCATQLVRSAVRGSDVFHNLSHYPCVSFIVLPSCGARGSLESITENVSRTFRFLLDAVVFHFVCIFDFFFCQRVYLQSCFLVSLPPNSTSSVCLEIDWYLEDKGSSGEGKLRPRGWIESVTHFYRGMYWWYFSPRVQDITYN